MIDQLKEYLRILGGFKYYVLIVILSFFGFVWAEINGYRVFGDDINSKETHSSSQHFYHK